MIIISLFLSGCQNQPTNQDSDSVIDTENQPINQDSDSVIGTEDQPIDQDSDSVTGTEDQPIDQDSNFITGTTYSKLNPEEILDTSYTGYSYTTNNGQFVITYDNSEVEVPISTSNTNMDFYDFGVFISDAKTAISYAENDVITVLFSNDQGNTWTSAAIHCDTEMTNLWIGFTSEDTGWLIGCSFVGMGTESHFLYTTVDGGKTWTLVNSNLDQEYSRLLVGANFLNQEIGFLCFRYEDSSFMPPILTTDDGGLTWSKLSLPIPEEYLDYRATALSPSYDGNQCILPVVLSSDDEETITINFISDDLGKTFTIQS